MHTVKQIRDTLELLVEYNSDQEAKSLLPYVRQKRLEQEDNDQIIFEVPDFYKPIVDQINPLLTSNKGLSIDEIGIALDKIGEPWPDSVIANAMQLKLLAEKNRLYPIAKIMRMRFAQ